MDKQPGDGYRRMQTMLAQFAAQQQTLRDRLRQVQEWSMSNGSLQGGQDADNSRLRREQVQQTQQQQDRLRQQAQRQGRATEGTRYG
jgi:hypothetical protein